MSYCFNETKNGRDFLYHTCPFIRKNALRIYSLQSILEFFPDYKAKDLIKYAEILAYCQRMIELIAMNEEEQDQEQEEQE